VPDEQAHVELAAPHLRGLAAKRWKAQSEKLASEKMPVTWEAFSVPLQSQHDGVIPEQESRQFLLDFRVAHGATPRVMTQRFCWLCEEVQLQQTRSHVQLPDGETLVTTYVAACARWSNVHKSDHIFHSDHRSSPIA